MLSTRESLLELASAEQELFSLHTTPRSAFCLSRRSFSWAPCNWPPSHHLADRMTYKGPGEFFKKNDAWRNHPMLTSRTQWRGAFPGLGIAVTAFAVYLFVDGMSKNLGSKDHK